MIALDEALLVLKGWEGRRLRVIFKSSVVEHVDAKCSLFSSLGTRATFVLREDFAILVNFDACLAEYGEPPRGTEDTEIESTLVFVREGVSLVVMLFLEDLE